MTLGWPSRHAGTALVVAMACAALAWRDCMLLATSLVLAHRLLLLRMDRPATWRPLAAAIDVLSIGVLTSGAATALMAGLAAAWLQWWQPSTEHVAASLLMLLLGALWCCLASRSRNAAMHDLLPWLWLGGGFMIAIEARNAGMEFAPCLFTAVVAIVLLWTGWRLATDTASALLHGGRE